MIYWETNFWFLLVAVLVLLRFRRRIKLKPLLFTLLAMFLMTAIFDNLIIGSGIVAYDESKISGLKIFLAPIEDFAYTVAAVMMIPAIWNSLRSRI
ncbi:MAG: hypothetical protein RIQ37_424 [Actinomycetota bacterium]